MGLAPSETNGNDRLKPQKLLQGHMQAPANKRKHQELPLFRAQSKVCGPRLAAQRRGSRLAHVRGQAARNCKRKSKKRANAKATTCSRDTGGWACARPFTPRSNRHIHTNAKANCGLAPCQPRAAEQKQSAVDLRIVACQANGLRRKSKRKRAARAGLQRAEDSPSCHGCLCKPLRVAGQDLRGGSVGLPACLAPVGAS